MRKHSLPYISPHAAAGLPADSTVLLAYSGGADSRALLHLLAGECRKSGAVLLCAHLNHGIRGDEALRDREFCVASAAGYGVECVVLDADVPALAKEHKRSLEAEAREVRYQFFEKLMRGRGILLLATAHNSDDRLETLIFNIARGCGLPGLCSIPAVRPFGPGYLVRPLLGASKSEIVDYCRERGLEYVNDSTNDDINYSRNLIRHRIIPLLEELNPGVRESAARLAAASSDARDLILSESDAIIRGYEGDIPISDLAALPPALRAAALSALCEGQGAGIPEQIHVSSLSEMILKGREGASVSLSGRVRATLSEGRLKFLPDTRERARPTRPSFEIPLNEGVNLIEGGALIMMPPGRAADNIPGMRLLYSLPIPCPAPALTARSLREGDGIKCRGMTKRVRRLLAERGLPPGERYLYPIICDGSGILWIPGVATRDGGLPSGGGLLLYYKEEKASERQHTTDGANKQGH